jgi:galactose mutarotase-like enzyme
VKKCGGGADLVDVLATGASRAREGLFEILAPHAERFQSFEQLLAPHTGIWRENLNCCKKSALIIGMAASQTLEKNGVTLDLLETSDLRIAVSRIGAEMISLARQDAAGKWQGFLYRDCETAPPESGWANHATVMGYFLHRLWKEQSNYRGSLIRGGNHGFLRHVAFDPPEVRDAALIYRVPASRVPPDAYPLKVSLSLSYALSSEGLRVEFLFTNEEAERDAHVSFGLHPGFAVSSLNDCKVLLPPGTYVRYFAPGNFLDGRTEKIEFAGGEMPFAKAKLPDSYLLGVEGVSKRIVVLEDPNLGRRIGFDFSEVPFLTLWSDSRTFICIEPCWGLPDSNPPKPFEEKIGIQRIGPGESLRRGFAISPEFLR